MAFSGGKDSQCVYHLCKMAGVKFDAHYNVTSVDPPELIYFIREHYPDVSFDYPRDKDGKRITMWSLIAKNRMPPTMRIRYCCEKLKETGGKGRVTVTGVRWAESAKRKLRPSMPYWYRRDLDGCWFCNHSNNCNQCKAARIVAKHDPKLSKKKEGAFQDGRFD